MNRIMMGAFGAFMVAACGCTTTYRVIEETPPVRPPVVSPTPASPVISVTAKSSDKNSSRLASSLKGAVESRLAARGMTVSSPLVANADVQLEVSRRETARLDEWRTYEGTARVRVMTTGPAAKLISETTVQASGTRALDEVKAEQGVVAGLTKQVNAWLDGTVTVKSIPVVQPAPPPGYAAARVRFILTGGSPDCDELLNAQIAFRTTVSAMPGIRDCRLADSGSDVRTAVFDITYEKLSFPDGLVNTIVSKLRQQKLKYEVER